METYNCKIKFITNYLYDQFTDESKIELVKKTSNGIQDVDNEVAKLSMYQDKKGLYIPANQIQKCIENSSKATKWKKTRSNWLKWTIAYLTVLPTEVYIDKKEPDGFLLSYPKRKDGFRVKKIHPFINAGLQVEFQILISDDDKQYQDKDIENLLVKSGTMYGVGGRRADKFGRFEVVSFKKK
jgi:hypothetical protein